MMENKARDKILEVNNLRVSFWTNNGTVKAVRGISFSLYRGNTLAIVGESGSGKSVTSRAIMGILAPNRIVEEGEILYDGHDILRLNEEELTRIRGSRIAMIFQDPMSSLNPIMKVGKQITEAMMLKRKAEIKEGKATANFLKKAISGIDPETSADFNSIITGKGEVNEQRLRTATEKLLEFQATRLSDGRKAAIDFLNNVLAGPYFDNPTAFPTIASRLGEMKNKIEACKDYYTERKDDVIFTFFVTFKYSIVSYREAVKREKTAAKLARKNAKKAAKGLSTDLTITQQAWASEIDLSSRTVVSKSKQFIVDFIAYLQNKSRPTGPEIVNNAAEVLSYFKKAVAASLLKVDHKEFKSRAIQVMREVGIPEPEKRLAAYPFQFSGGMRQRIVIAIALSSNPEILICDEPTTALDVTIQAQILDLINDLKKTRNLSVIFITHNLGVVANMADDIAIMYAGRIVEYGTVDEIFYNPKHPYTWALLNSMPDLNTKERLDAIPGTPPNMIVPPKGDAFAARNKYAMKVDYEKQPPFFKVTDDHYAATWLLDPRSPHVDPPTSVTERIKRFQALNADMIEQRERHSKAEQAFLDTQKPIAEGVAGSKSKGGKKQ